MGSLMMLSFGWYVQIEPDWISPFKELYIRWGFAYYSGCHLMGSLIMLSFG
jgi:hypothetical protein